MALQRQFCSTVALFSVYVIFSHAVKIVQGTIWCFCLMRGNPKLVEAININRKFLAFTRYGGIWSREPCLLEWRLLYSSSVICQTSRPVFLNDGNFHFPFIKCSLLYMKNLATYKVFPPINGPFWFKFHFNAIQFTPLAFRCKSTPKPDFPRNFDRHCKSVCTDHVGNTNTRNFAIAK